jgi:hypothetical protein
MGHKLNHRDMTDRFRLLGATGASVNMSIRIILHSWSARGSGFAISGGMSVS